MSGSLTGQWALVTGASKGIGFGIAEKLVGDGANLVLVARNPDDLDEAARNLAELAGPDQELVVRPADTADPGAIAGLFAWVRQDLPGLNILVANAGSGAVIPFLELSLDSWDSTLALNLTGTFLCMQEAARIMVEMPEGSNRAVVVVSSIRGLGVRPGLAAYAATKAAVNQLVRMAAYELAPHGIRVNALSPGITVTPLVAASMEADPEILAARTADVPMGRPGQPEDMGGAALFLCQPSSAFVTGTNLIVDGGESLR
ncbi:MAG: SDR family NAD(P)-dependent oxidoreductase [Acidimicrobiales bacterium]